MPKHSGYTASLKKAIRLFDRQIEANTTVVNAIKKSLKKRITVKVGNKMMSAMKVHKTKGYDRYRVQDPKKFDPRSFRVIDPGRPGHTKMVVACPKGYFRGGRCRVGMTVQAVLKAK